MEWKKEVKILAWIITVFVLVYFLPVSSDSFNSAIYAMFDLAKWYAREHVVLCLLPAFFIAGVIAVFISQASVIKYFGANAKKWLSYSIASVSGTILAVCSCTILPLFSSIHKRGAGLGPAIAFLYSGPAINILAIILTARILGWELGIARIIGAVVFAIIIGYIMSVIYRKEENVKIEKQIDFPDIKEKRPIWQTSFHFFILVLILILANWGKPSDGISEGGWFWIWSNKWFLTSGASILFCCSLIFILKIRWYLVLLLASITACSALITSSPIISVLVGITGLSIITIFDRNNDENREWTLSSWDFAKQILPLLAIGVLIAGFLLGSTHGDTQIAGIIPNEWVSKLVGGNSIFSNLFASLTGAFMYFATLTEVPILQGLLNAGMGKGPALALLLAGPSLSLPNMLVIKSVIGVQKTVVYVILVVIMATISGIIFGLI